MNRVRDRLEPLGIVVGALLVLFGLGTVYGTPWTTKGSVLASGLQLVGVLAMIAVGVALVWLSRLD
jgi:protein-S-isoprenylcysteine O-methyltransferase Ste14